MGMSATQARYLALTAQQTNLEYQGQQINQERTILSQQVSDLYNNLLNMQVPTPPSTQDYTRVEYSGQVGATVYNFDATTVKPTGQDTFSVTVRQDAYGNSLVKNVGIGTVDPTSGTTTNNDIMGIRLAAAPTSPNSAVHWVSRDGGTTFTRYVSGDESDPTVTDWYESNPKGSVTLATGQTLNTYGTFDDHDLYTLDEALATGVIGTGEYDAYLEAIKNSGLTDLHGNPYKKDDFYFYLDDKGNAKFVLKTDIEDGNTNAISYSYLANGNYANTHTYEGCKLTFDPANGRITELSIPNYDAGGNLLSYTAMKVEASSVTDELAYNEAMAQYEYEQYEYDKKQQEINAKTEIIQQQDRNLELKLQRLDTQRTQITTEMDAIKKVLNDNIESSYKAFSG